MLLVINVVLANMILPSRHILLKILIELLSIVINVLIFCHVLDMVVI